MKGLLSFLLLVGCLILTPIQTAGYTLNLGKDWNLANLPLSPNNTKIEALFQGAETKVISLWTWENGTWNVSLLQDGLNATQAYIQAMGFELLTDIKAGQGFWVNCEQDLDLSVAGSAPAEQTLTAASGWNLLGLKSEQTVNVPSYFSQVGESLTSVWAWQDANWAVYLFGQDADTQSYIQAKGFQLLTSILPGQGFWVNALTDTGAFPAPPTQGQVLNTSGEAFSPIQGATVLLDGEPIASSDGYGLFEYNGSEAVQIEVQAPGYANGTCLLQPNTLTPIRLNQAETVPEAFSNDSSSNATYGPDDSYNASTFIALDNPYTLPVSLPPIPAKPTPKAIGDQSSALIITKMELKNDITVSVNSFESTDELQSLEQFLQVSAGTSWIIGGADVLLIDSVSGQPTSSQAAGFKARVRPVTTTNLSQTEKSLADMQTELEQGTGKVYLFVFQDAHWGLVGEGRIGTANQQNFVVAPEDGVFGTSLVPFCYVFAQTKTVTGTLTAGGGEPVVNALVTQRGFHETAVSDQNGQFSLAVPDVLPEVQLRIARKGFYLEEATAVFAGSESSHDLGTLQLTAMDTATLQGTVTNIKQEALHNATVVATIQVLPDNILLSKRITAGTNALGEYSIPDIPVEILDQITLNCLFGGGYDPDLALPLNDPSGAIVFQDIALAVPDWTYQTNGAIYGSARLDNGTVFIGSCDGKMYALEAKNGDVTWEYQTNTDYTPLPILSTPALDQDAIYFGTMSNHFYAVNISNGSLVWNNKEIVSFAQSNPDIISSPALVPQPGDAESLLFFGATDGTMLEHNTANGLQNTIAVNGSITVSPAVDQTNKNIFFGDWSGRVYSYSYASGFLSYTPDWQFPSQEQSPLSGRILSSPALHQGRVYFGGGNAYNGTAIQPGDTHLYCLDAANGTQIWKHEFGGSLVASPVIQDDRLYIGCLDNTIYCLDISSDTPSEPWTFSTGDAVHSTPLVVNGRLYCGSNDGYLYCLDAETGQKLWRLKTRGQVVSSPKYADGRIYFGSTDGVIYCVEVAAAID